MYTRRDNKIEPQNLWEPIRSFRVRALNVAHRALAALSPLPSRTINIKRIFMSARSESFRREQISAHFSLAAWTKFSEWTARMLSCSRSRVRSLPFCRFALLYAAREREKKNWMYAAKKEKETRRRERERAGKKTRAPIRARPLKNVCGRDLPWYLPLSRARDRSKKRRLSLRETENMISSWEGPQYVFYSLVLRLSFSRVFLFRRQRPGRPTPSPKGGRPSARPEF